MKGTGNGREREREARHDAASKLLWLKLTRLSRQTYVWYLSMQLSHTYICRLASLLRTTHKRTDSKLSQQLAVHLTSSSVFLLFRPVRNCVPNSADSNTNNFKQCVKHYTCCKGSAASFTSTLMTIGIDEWHEWIRLCWFVFFFFYLYLSGCVFLCNISQILNVFVPSSFNSNALICSFSLHFRRVYFVYYLSCSV